MNVHVSFMSSSILALVQPGIFLCFIFIIKHYHAPEQRKYQILPRVKLNRVTFGYSYTYCLPMCHWSFNNLGEKTFASRQKAEKV